MRNSTGRLRFVYSWCDMDQTQSSADLGLLALTGMYKLLPVLKLEGRFLSKTLRGSVLSHQ